MSQGRLPVIGSAHSKTSGKPQMGGIELATRSERSNLQQAPAPEGAVDFKQHSTDGTDHHLCLRYSCPTTAKPALSSPVVHQSKRRRSQRQPAASSSSSSRPHPGPSSSLLSDSSVTPWGGQVLHESSFTSLTFPRPPPPLPPTPPAPRPTPSTPYRGKQTRDRRVVSGEATSSAGVLHRDSAGFSV